MSQRLAQITGPHPWVGLIFVMLGCLLAAAYSFQLALLVGVFVLAAAASFAAGSAPAMDRRVDLSVSYYRALFFGIVLLAALLRFWHLDFGFPSFLHPDEGPKGRIVQRMLAEGTFHPHYFLHPSLLLYSTLFLAKIFYPLTFRPDELEAIVLLGRAVSALAGTASVVFLLLIGSRTISPTAGLIAGAVLAVSPLHVTCSRYMKEDSLFVCFLLATTLATVHWTQERNIRSLCLAAFLAGVSAGAKYTGLLCGVLVAASPVVIFFLAPFDRWTAAKRAILLSVIALGVLMPLGFLLTTPYAVLDANKFAANFQIERQHMSDGHHRIAISAWSQYWMYHFSRSLLPGIGFASCLVGVFGLGAGLRKGNPWGFLFFGLFMLFYLPAEWVKAKPPPQAERYVLACVPFLALGVGSCIHCFCSCFYSSANRVLVGILLGVCIGFPFYRTVALARELEPDTRQLMAEWIAANVPVTASILIEASYSPRLSDLPHRTKLAKAMKSPTKFMTSRLKESGFDYLVVSGFSYERYFNEPRTNPLLKKRFANIFSRFRLVKEISKPHGSYGFHNPTLRLYALREDAVP